MSTDLQLPAGFRFHPTDEELVLHYLCRKCASQPIAVPIIKEIDLYKFDPWDLPGMALYGEKEWYFFSPRERKYPNGSRPNRAAGRGYWKATGADKPVGKPKTVGIKKALVFYSGKAPKGDKTNWIMHEYRLADVDRSIRKKNSSRLDDWVLCRIYNKKGSTEKQPDNTTTNNQSDGVSYNLAEIEDKKPEGLVNHAAVAAAYGGAGYPPAPHTTVANDFMYFDKSDSIPRLHTDSSGSEHVVSPEFTSEVQSEPKWKEFGNNVIEDPFNYFDTTSVDTNNGLFASQFNAGNNQMWPLQDMFMYLQKPF
ncbi:hypothetical protein ACFE04_012103 [Oxalis oulophora]